MVCARMAVLAMLASALACGKGDSKDGPGNDQAVAQHLGAAQVKTARLELRTLGQCVQRSMLDNGKPAASIADLRRWCRAGDNDPWGTPWKLDGEVVSSAGPDRQFGTADDLTSKE